MRTDIDATKRIRLAILASHPIQYLVPLFRELEQCPNIELTVLYRTRAGIDKYHDLGFGQTVQWDIPLLGGYRHHFLSDKAALGGFQPAVAGILLRQRFDVLIVHGYNSITNILGMTVAKLAGTRILLRGDTRLQPHHQNATRVKTWIKRRIFSWCDGFLFIGSLNREYYEAFGVSADQLHFAPLCVNNAAFCLDTERRLAQRRESRQTMGLPPESVILLYASKLAARKRPADLILAFSKISSDFPAAWLIVAGAGEEEQKLRNLVQDLGVPRTLFIGFRNQTELPKLYAASDIFILPAEREPWGLVVNEVMAAGIPVIVSDQVGASPDLVDRQNTGIVYRCGDVDGLTDALAELLQSRTKREAMGGSAQNLISSYDVNACATGIVDAVFEVSGVTR